MPNKPNASDKTFAFIHRRRFRIFIVGLATWLSIQFLVQIFPGNGTTIINEEPYSSALETCLENLNPRVFSTDYCNLEQKRLAAVKKKNRGAVSRGAFWFGGPPILAFVLYLGIIWAIKKNETMS